MVEKSCQENIERAAGIISAARYAIVFTGAGISTPSGIPDFRGEKEGLWQKYDPMRVASRTAFKTNPQLFFDWFRPLFMTSWKALPNPAHLGIADLENRGLIKSVITQNIDGLHQKAGSQNVFELHGSALTFACPNCRTRLASENVFSQFKSGVLIPICDHCGKNLKPDVVLFEEPLPAKTWQQAETEAGKADLILVVGSSLEVYPACTIPEIAVQRGGQLIINNLDSTPLDRIARLLLPMDAAKFIPLLVKELS